MSGVTGFVIMAVVMVALAVVIATVALWRGDAAGQSSPRRFPGVMVALALGIPLASGLLYLELGSPSLLAAPPSTASGDEVESTAGAMPPISEESVASAAGELIRQLEIRLENDPEDTHAWILLARSLLFEERYADAADAFSHAVEQGTDDVTVLTQYADVLAHTRGGSLAGEPERVLHEALRIDPEYGHALWLAGNAAYQQGHHEQTLEYWGRLLPQLEPGSEPALVLEANMRQVREQMQAPAEGG